MVSPIIPEMPELPADVRERFPSLAQWQKDQQTRAQQLQKVLNDLADALQTVSGSSPQVSGDDGKVYTLAVQVVAGVATPVAVPV